MREIIDSIRSDELYMMRLEEKRSHLANSFRKPRETERPDPIIALASKYVGEGPREDPASARAPSGSGALDSQIPDDLAVLTQQLAVPRTYHLLERNSERVFEFSIVPSSSVHRHAIGKLAHKYALRWGMGNKVAGFALLSDMKGVKLSEKDRSIVVIVLPKNSAQAVCNSGGLNLICIKTGSADEGTVLMGGILKLIETTDE